MTAMFGFKFSGVLATGPYLATHRLPWYLQLNRFLMLSVYMYTAGARPVTEIEITNLTDGSVFLASQYSECLIVILSRIDALGPLYSH